MALGAGWNLASIVDSATGAAVMSGTCAGALSASDSSVGSGYWVGLSRGNGIPSSNRTDADWTWSSGTSNAFFLSTAGASWWGAFWNALKPSGQAGYLCVQYAASITSLLIFNTPASPPGLIDTDCTGVYSGSEQVMRACCQNVGRLAL